jgi:hypothetical protein
LITWASAIGQNQTWDSTIQINRCNSKSIRQASVILVNMRS